MFWRSFGSIMSLVLLVLVTSHCGSGSTFCPEKQSACGEKCVELERDRLHCGICGNACSNGYLCVKSECTLACPEGQNSCGSSCRELSSDPLHCGACGNACGFGEICFAGGCTSKCPKGTSFCNGRCVDFSSNSLHCGGCGKHCTKNNYCSAGTCVDSCSKDEFTCSKSCVLLASDRFHCGSCGNVCRAGESCSKGKCLCSSSLSRCSGHCVDVKSSPDHCGKCTQRCQQGDICMAGKCRGKCSQSQPNICLGRCVDIQSDVNHCGQCGHFCKESELCSKGKCSPKCTGTMPDLCFGSCVDKQSSKEHCGFCGNICPKNSACKEGKCELTCSKGKEKCTSICVDLARDSQNCGGCGQICSSGKSCLKGRCVEGNPLSGLSDEFDDPRTLGNWKLRHKVESTVKPYTSLDIDQSTKGYLTVFPSFSSWFNNTVGFFLYKEVTGNFIMMSSVRPLYVKDTTKTTPPKTPYHSAGLLVRDPASSASKKQNWLMLNLGYQVSYLGTEAEEVLDSKSKHYRFPSGFIGKLLICRIGSEFSMYRLLEGETKWKEIKSFIRTDFPKTLQVGLAVSSYKNRKLRAEFDYVRFDVPQKKSDCTTKLKP